MMRMFECRFCGDTNPGHACTENEPWGDEDDAQNERADEPGEVSE